MPGGCENVEPSAPDAYPPMSQGTVLSRPLLLVTTFLLTRTF